MLRLDVTTQVNLALEGLGAEVAGEGLEAGVLAAVRDQVGRLAERLAAHATHVRLLSCNATRMRLIITFGIHVRVCIVMNYGQEADMCKRYM